MEVKPKQHILVAIPSIRAEVKLFTALSLISTVSECYRGGINAEVVAWAGDSILPSARNVLFGKFYKDPKYTDMVFIDDDIAWGVGEFVRLLSHDVPMVGATYRTKTEEIRFPIRTLPGSEHHTDPKTGLLEVAAVPTGFLRIRRDAAEVLVNSYPERQYTPHHADAEQTWCLFEWPFRKEGLWGEDFGFCELYRSAGGKVWLDPKIALSHVGVREHGPISLHDHLKASGKLREKIVKPEKVVELKTEFAGGKFDKVMEQALGRSRRMIWVIGLLCVSQLCLCVSQILLIKHVETL